MNTNNNLWLFPTIQYKLAKIVDDISEGYSCCLAIFPPIDESDLADALLGRLLHAGIDARQVHLSGGVSIRQLSTDGFGVNHIYTSLQELLMDDGVLALTVFQGFDTLDSHGQTEMIFTLNQWIELQHSGFQKSFCLLVDGGSIPVLQSLRQGPKLKTQLLIGIPSVAEIQVYLRLTNTWTNEIDAKWYEMLLSSLAGNDLRLLQHLASRPLNNFDDIVCALNQFEMPSLVTRSDFEKDVSGWKPNPLSQPVQFRSLRNSELLSKQICIFQPEHGEEIHPVILAVLQRYEEIRHRVWRFQSTLVLPLIDQIRQKLFLLLKDKIPYSGGDDIPEIGDLKFSLGSLDRDNVNRQMYYESVQNASYIRNKIAHLQTISKSEYESVSRFWEQISQKEVPGK